MEQQVMNNQSNRRKFLKQSALGGAFAGLASLSQLPRTVALKHWNCSCCNKMARSDAY